MAIRYALHTHQKNGQIETSVLEFAVDELLIGRGEKCHIRLVSPAVSLQHAKLTSQQDKLLIEDLRSFSGVLVNNSLVSSGEIKSGDKLRIAEFTLEISREDATWIITENRYPREHESEENFIQTTAKKLEVSDKLPSMFLLSASLSLLILVAFLFIPFTTKDFSSWSSGEVSSAHTTFGDNCSACHELPFQKVEDEACLACHKVTNHGNAIGDAHAKKLGMGRCADCHIEHKKNDGIILADSKLCLECHASIDSVSPESDVTPVPSVAEHPQFRISVATQDGSLNRVSIADSKLVKDTNSLKLNHAIHLESGLAGPDGLATLQCNDCHLPSESGKGFRPITFENQCQSCHSLKYDERLPDVSVPHEDANEVFSFLRNHYATLFLEREGEISTDKAQRRMPGDAIERAKRLKFYRENVQLEAREMEEELFTKLSCNLCHSFEEKKQFSEDEARFNIVKPITPEHWLPNAVFDHSAHQTLSCDSCHGGVRESETTEDVLLPEIATCLECHHDTSRGSRIESNCITCHSYHDKTPLSEGHKRTIDYLKMTSIR